MVCVRFVYLRGNLKLKLGSLGLNMMLIMSFRTAKVDKPWLKMLKYYADIIINKKETGVNMASKVKTSKDYPTVFQITQVDKDKFVVLGVMNKKQLEALLWRLEEE